MEKALYTAIIFLNYLLIVDEVLKLECGGDKLMLF